MGLSSEFSVEYRAVVIWQAVAVSLPWLQHLFRYVLYRRLHYMICIFCVNI